MISAENEKAVLMIPPSLKDNTTFTTNSVDTAGFKFLVVMLLVGATDTTIGSTTAAGAIQLEASQNGTDWADIEAAVLSDAIPADGDNKIYRFELDLVAAPQSRYIRIKAPTAGDGTSGANLCAVGVLSKFSYISPDSNTERGVEELVTVN